MRLDLSFSNRSLAISFTYTKSATISLCNLVLIKISDASRDLVSKNLLSSLAPTVFLYFLVRLTQLTSHQTIGDRVLLKRSILQIYGKVSEKTPLGASTNSCENRQSQALFIEILALEGTTRASIGF